jgi:hypothetical protein
VRLILSAGEGRSLEEINASLSHFDQPSFSISAPYFGGHGFYFSRSPAIRWFLLSYHFKMYVEPLPFFIHEYPANATSLIQNIAFKYFSHYWIIIRKHSQYYKEIFYMYDDYRLEIWTETK